MNATFVTFGDGTVDRHTYYLPNGNDAIDVLLRKLASDVFRHVYQLRKAYLDHSLDFIILMPTDWIPLSLRGDYREGTLMGEKWHLCDDIATAMIAYELALKDLP